MTNEAHIVVLVTCPPDGAAELARAVVSDQLAACANILSGVRSIYRWKGEICDDEEALLVIKTRASLFERLRARMATLHPYDVPEIIALPLTAGHAPYLDWITRNTGA